MTSERAIWKLSVVIEATTAEMDAATAAIARALCADDAHEGECEVPWTTLSSRFEDLDDAEQASWRESFAEDHPGQ